MDLVNLIVNGGPFVMPAVLAFILWTVHTERKDLQEKLNQTHTEYIERLITAINASAEVTRNITSTMATINNTLQNAVFRRRENPNDPEPRL